jgi:hypothetical protein
MIYQSLAHIAAELNQYLRRSSIAGEDIVVLANPVDADGRSDPLSVNKVVLFLAGIARDTVLSRSGDSRVLARAAPTFLNLHVMVAANFPGRSYAESLKYIARVIAFFQMSPVFDRNNSPALDEGIDKLILDMENLDRRELSNIWGMFGGKYLPSVLYRVRMVSIDAQAVAGRRHLVSEHAIGTHHGAGN